MVVRYLYEAQYLRFSAVADRRTFLLRSTWLAADVLGRGCSSRASTARSRHTSNVERDHKTCKFPGAQSRL